MAGPRLAKSCCRCGVLAVAFDLPEACLRADVSGAPASFQGCRAEGRKVARARSRAIAARRPGRPEAGHFRHSREDAFMNQRGPIPVLAWLVLFFVLSVPVPAWSDETVALPPAQTVAVDDVVLGYRILGSGKPLLCITGYGCTMDTWDPELLAALARHHRLILFDNMGMGASTASGQAYTIDRLADDAAGLLTVLGIDRADVLGWSMGAMVALELGLRHPEVVDRLVAYGAADDPKVVTEAVDGLRRMSGEAFMAQLFPRSWWVAHPDALARLPKPAIAPNPDTMRRQRDAIAGWAGFGDRLAGLDKEVLLVVGQDDTITPPAQSLALAGKIPGSWLVRFRDAGHWLMYQMPSDLARVVEAFLDRRDALAQ